MPFQVTPNVHVVRDAEGRVRHLRHNQQPYVSMALTRPTPSALAMEYTGEVAPVYEIDPRQLENLANLPPNELTDDGTELHFASEKVVMETSTVSFVQTHLGLPIWEAGVSVTTHSSPQRVTSSTCAIHHKVEAKRPGRNAKFMPEKINPDVLGRVIGRTGDHRPRVRPKINSKRMLVFRYEPGKRFDPETQSKQPGGQPGAVFEQAPPTLPLPPVSREIKAMQHYVVSEVMFTLSLPQWPDLNWRVFIEVESGAALYLRALVACCDASVYVTDPLTATGDATIIPTSPAATLDPLRTTLGLNGLAAANPQPLTGDFVTLVDEDLPNVAPPTEPSPPCNFIYEVPTDNFAAAQAYYACDLMFRMVQDMGFDMATYFDGTTFPVPVDARGFNGAVNARANGNAGGDGMGRFDFGVAGAGSTVGIQADPRVCLHEFGHTLLWDSVHSPNFGFAHSAGDSLACILHDPGSLVPDRFLSFPWITTTRRHDRAVAGGWAWGGVSDVGGYNSEQILSTTLFRGYRSSGGDSLAGDPAVQLARRQFAARYMAYLIIRAIGSLATSPITPTPEPDVFATALIDADAGTALFEGHPGGAFHKVVRWAFEKQGLYQPAGAPIPVVTEGAPPPVDVYINDGRNGEYPYQYNFWNTTDIWNRLAPDGGAAHETPILDVPNYVYVKVRNRGTDQANDVVVSAFHCEPGSGLVWPDDWQPMTTPELVVGGGIAPGAVVTVGPFEWTPEVEGHECLLLYVSATGDLANTDAASLLASATGPIPHWRLVPFDNNIGQRNVAPVPGGGGGFNLARAFAGRRFRVNNPFERTVRVVLDAVLPDFLVQRGWELRFVNAGGRAFTLGPRAHRYAEMQLKPGNDFTPQDVADANIMIEVHTLIDHQITGGMSYQIDPKLKTPPNERPKAPTGPDCKDAAQTLLDCLKLPGDAKSARVRRITIDIDLKEDC